MLALVHALTHPWPHAPLRSGTWPNARRAKGKRKVLTTSEQAPGASRLRRVQFYQLRRGHSPLSSLQIGHGSSTIGAAAAWVYCADASDHSLCSRQLHGRFFLCLCSRYGDFHEQSKMFLDTHLSVPYLQKSNAAPCYVRHHLGA